MISSASSRGACRSPSGISGQTGRHIGFGGYADAAININQIDPAMARQQFPAPGGGWNAGALLEEVPNPFFGIAQAGELGTRETIPRGQLLRPFPAFGDVQMYDSTAGSKRQYHAIATTLSKRLQEGWGGRFSYTWSRLKDNQFAESSFTSLAPMFHRTATISQRSTASATSMRRTASCSRRW